MSRRRRRLRLIHVLLLLVLTAGAGAGGWAILRSNAGGSGSPVPRARALPRTPLQVENGPAATPLQDPATAIALDKPDRVRVRFKHRPRAGLVFDVTTGEVLWRHHPLRERPVASLTKIMSALLVVDRVRANERVRITRPALRYTGSGVGVLPKGRHVPAEALLHGMMLVSGNDAAIALAVHMMGSERRFVRRMNTRARRIGLTCTHFASSHGLEPGNRSCPVDLAAMTRLAMKEPRIRRVVRKRRAVMRFPIKGGRLHLYSTNPLLKGRYPGAIGLKTGSTDEAGRCLVAVARRRGRTLGVVLLRSPDPGKQARRLLNAAFRAR